MATVKVGVFDRDSLHPLVGVTVAELDANQMIVTSGVTDEWGVATLTLAAGRIPVALVARELQGEIITMLLDDGGGAASEGPFAYDILVDGNYTGTEGEQHTTFHGHVYNVVSTIQYAWDGVGTMTGAKDFTSDCTVLIVPGGGIGQLATNADSSGTANTITFVGVSPEDSYIPGTSSVHAVNVDNANTTKTLIFRNIGFANVTTGQKPFTTSGAGAGPALIFDNCIVGNAVGDGPIITDNPVFAYNTQFPVSQGGQYALDLNGNSYYNRYHDCVFGDRIRLGDEGHFLNCIHDKGASSIGFLSGPGSSGTVYIHGSVFRTSAAAFSYYIDIADDYMSFDVRACEANVGATAAIRVQAAFNQAGAHQHVVGNKWGCDLGLDHQGATLMAVNYSGNSHTGTIGAGLATAVPIIAQGKFQRSEFSGNHPAGSYVSFTAGSLMNRVNGVLTDITNAGAPTHVATEGQIYWDAGGDTLWINNDGSTGWTQIVSGVAQSVKLLDGSEHTDTAAGIVARGDVITGQGVTPAWTRLVKGAATTFLMSDGTDAIWSAVTHGSLAGIGTDDHHAQAHTPESHTGTDITAAELEELTSGTLTSLHNHTGGAGEANTASNVGVAGDVVGWFKQKTGIDLEFKGIDPLSSRITVGSAASVVQVDVDVTAMIHGSLGSIGTDDHHAQSHALNSHSSYAHSDLTGIAFNDHHGLLTHGSLSDAPWDAHHGLLTHGSLSDAPFDAHHGLLTHGSLSDAPADAHHAQAHVHDANVITFTPNVPTDWYLDMDPGDTNDALDQLAWRAETSESFYHNQAHAIDGGDHSGTLDHSEIANQAFDDHHGLLTHGSLSDAPADAHHAQLHAAAHKKSGADELDVEEFNTAGALNTVAMSDGAAGVSMAQLWISKSFVFTFHEETLLSGIDFNAQTPIQVPASGEHGLMVAKALRVTLGSPGAGGAGGSTTNIQLQKSTTLGGARTAFATATLPAGSQGGSSATFVDGSLANDLYLWMRATADLGTSPGLIHAQLDIMERVFPST